MAPATGILAVDKPAGVTSHDVVARLRRITGVRRIGHGGTLDPLATGVLPLLIGTATRMAEYMARWQKTYRFTIRLGQSTDTYDAEGSVSRVRNAGHISAADIEAALPRFRGDISQCPPVYSAIKRAGRPLYEYARAQRPVELEARQVRVDRLELLKYRAPDAELLLECGSGTYARSLANDIGEALGCGAHVVELVRTAVGPLTLEGAYTIEAIEAAAKEERWSDLLLPPDTALSDAPAVTLGEIEFESVAGGRSVRVLQSSESADGDLCCAYDGRGRFVAVLRYDEKAAVWRPRKVFVAQAATAGRAPA